MKILMLATSSTPEGHMHEGKVYNVDRKTADAYCKPGPHGLPYARKVGPEDADEPVSQMAKPPEPNTGWQAEE